MSKHLGLFFVDEVHDAKVGNKVTYISYKWKVIAILPQGSRVLYRPWWKVKKTGVIIV